MVGHLAAMEDSWDSLDKHLWWTVALVASTGVLLARRGYVHYAEQGRGAAHVFALRARSLPYITASALLAAVAVVFAFFHEIAEGIAVAAFVFGEFVAVCLWRDYFGNSDFFTQCVKENRERLKYLLTCGLGMTVHEFDYFLCMVEEELVDFWRMSFKNKKWRDLSEEEKGKLLFESGVRSGTVMTRVLSEDVLFDVAAFMREWLTSVEHVRVPSDLNEIMKEERDSDEQSLQCVGIILANETREIREQREKDSTNNLGRQFSGARIARRKAASEGILRFPNCLSKVDDIKVKKIGWNTDELYIVHRHNKSRCEDYTQIPGSVRYSLRAIMEAGYLRICPEGKVCADVTFSYSSMGFKKDEWNQLRTIERKPFRYITSATWMSGDPAFMVEQREGANRATALDGSGALAGMLHIEADVNVTVKEHTWLDLADWRSSYSGIWGDTRTFIQEVPVSWLNFPVLWMIEGMWALFGLLNRVCAFFAKVRNGRTVEPSRPLRSDSFRTPQEVRDSLPRWKAESRTHDAQW